MADQVYGRQVGLYDQILQVRISRGEATRQKIAKAPNMAAVEDNGATGVFGITSSPDDCRLL